MRNPDIVISLSCSILDHIEQMDHREKRLKNISQVMSNETG